MGKIKLLILLATSVLSIYVLNKAATSAVTATDSTQLPLPGGATGLKPKMLSTSIVPISAADLVKIRAGTFTTAGPTGGTVCPATPDCGTASTVPTKYGLANCPNTCYVKVVTGAAPPAGGPSYPVCPTGYAVVNTGTMDLMYQLFPQLTRWPGSQGEMDGYTSTGYVCNPDPSIETQICEDPYHTNTGDYAQIMGRWSKAVYTECRANCSWGASSCGVAHVLMVTWQAMRCIRPAGNYPVESQYDPNGAAANVNPYYKMAPDSIICGHVRTQWVDS